MHPPQNLCLLAREAKALAIGDPAAPAVRASILALATARCDATCCDPFAFTPAHATATAARSA
jgi:hypothetical protein